MNRLVHYGAVLLVIAAIAAGLLSSVNSITAPQIAKINMQIENQARIDVLPKASTFAAEKSVVSKKQSYMPGYDKAGNLVGYAATVQVNGYSGVITFVLGLGLDGKVTGLKVTSQTETPGLGTNIERPEWQKLWIGRDKTYKFDKSVDAFAGASVTPTAVYYGVMRAARNFEGVKK